MPLLAYNCSPEHILPPLMPNFCTLQRTIPRFRRKLSAQLIRKLSQRHSRLQTLLPDNSIPVNLERSPEPEIGRASCREKVETWTAVLFSKSTRSMSPSRCRHTTHK